MVESLFPPIIDLLMPEHKPKTESAQGMTSTYGLTLKIDDILELIRKVIIVQIDEEPRSEITQMVYLLLLKVNFKPTVLFPNLEMIEIHEPDQSAINIFEKILDVLAQTCRPKIICMNLTNCGTAYHSFNRTLELSDLSITDKKLHKLYIFNMSAGQLPKPSTYQITVSFHHKAFEQKKPDRYGRYSNSQALKLNCCKQLAIVILKHVQAYPEDKFPDYPPLKVVPSQSEVEEYPSRNIQKAGREGNVTEKTISQTSMICSRFDQLVEIEAGTAARNPDQDEEVTQNLISEWKSRVIFVKKEEAINEPIGEGCGSK
ncbi:uncharacterized protein IL334_002271 [Kwoniella shivajii]|uniref:Uncharacterized protein n=1 Tax=Kwoniella shivajii TaxID=564305 RepID=A0ABZ1CUD5_9TREE|nr:hypothetical protein IL334_002271 [Kwoniella shivajii]